MVDRKDTGVIGPNIISLQPEDLGNHLHSGKTGISLTYGLRMRTSTTEGESVSITVVVFLLTSGSESG